VNEVQCAAYWDDKRFIFIVDKFERNICESSIIFPFISFVF